MTKGVGEIYAELLSTRGYQINLSKLNDSVSTEWRNLQPLYLNEAQSYQTTPEREREVWVEYVRRVLARAEVSYQAHDDVVDYIYNSFATKRYRTVAPGALHFIVKARERGIAVVAATNNDERSKSALRELGVLKTLDGIFTAGDLGWKKPSPRFFESLENKLGVAPSALVHVGNSNLLDIAPAERAGWRAIFFGSRNDDGQSSVQSFEELKRLLRV